MKKQRIRLFRRENGIYYSLDTTTKKRHSLETTQLDEARRLINAENEAARQPAINLQIARAYLQHSDPNFALRTWAFVMDEMGRTKTGNTKKRWDVAIKDKAFASIQKLPLIKTQAEHFLEVLHGGTVSTNVFLRRINNFALDMDWIPKPGHSLPLRPRVPENTLKAYELQIERKAFVFQLRENSRGRFLRIVEQGCNQSVSIIIPSTGLNEFKSLLAEMLKAAEAMPPKPSSGD